jgi:hypothetical protein
MPVFCQPADLKKIHRLGFEQIYPIDEFLAWNGFQFRRIPGRHGLGWLGKLMGPSSGFTIRFDAEPCLFLTGDTVWYPELERTLQSHRPDVIVAYTGEARFNWGGPITLDAEGIGQICKAVPRAKVLPVHMEALNHCRLGRNELTNYCMLNHIEKQVFILGDGETIALG